MSGDRRGNVLYITVDQWRADCLSALGHPVVRTPTLDRLASSGVLFAIAGKLTDLALSVLSNLLLRWQDTAARS